MRAHGWLANNAQKWEYGRTVAFSGSRYSSEYPLTRASARIVSRGIDAENAKRGSATKHLPPELSTRNISPTARSRSDKIVNRREVTNWLNELSGCGRLRTSPHAKAQFAKPSPSLSPAHISPAPSSCRLQEPRFFENAAPRHERKIPGHSQAPAPWNSLVVLRPAKTHELSVRYHHEKVFHDKKCKSRRNARRGCLVSRQLRPGMAG